MATRLATLPASMERSGFRILSNTASGREPNTQRRSRVMLSIAWSGTALAARADNEAAVVAKLYKDFAWQAVASQADLFGDDLAHQGKAALEKYFAPALADLLVKD